MNCISICSGSVEHWWLLKSSSMFFLHIKGNLSLLICNNTCSFSSVSLCGFSVPIYGHFSLIQFFFASLFFVISIYILQYAISLLTLKCQLLFSVSSFPVVFLSLHKACSLWPLFLYKLLTYLLLVQFVVLFISSLFFLKFKYLQVL